MKIEVEIPDNVLEALKLFAEKYKFSVEEYISDAAFGMIEADAGDGFRDWAGEDGDPELADQVKVLLDG